MQLANTPDAALSWIVTHQPWSAYWASLGRLGKIDTAIGPPESWYGVVLQAGREAEERQIVVLRDTWLQIVPRLICLDSTKPELYAVRMDG